MTIIYSILNYSLFGDRIIDYLTFLTLIFMSWPLSKLVAFILKDYLIVWANKTSTKLDDILFESLNPPITIFIIAILFHIGSTYIQGSLKPFLDKIYAFLIIIPIVYFMIKFITEMISHYLKGDKRRFSKVNEAAIDLLMQIIKIGLFLIGILLILDNLGYNVSALITGLGVGGLAFALAAQDLLKNFFAGISLIFDKTFGKGEKVNFEGYSGIIEELKLRSTKLRTYDGTLLTIPNAKLSDNIVENVTKVPRVKVKMVLGLTYDTSTKKIKKAKEIIQNIIDEHPDADGDSTTIYFDNFGAYSLDIKVYYYAKSLTMHDWHAWVKMKDEINMEIKERFEKAGIEFAFPTQTIELKK